MIVYGDADFREYLEARYSVDGDSLNKRTHAEFAALLAKAEAPVLLDLGTGTGAMIRRLIEAELVPQLVIYGVDANRDLLDSGRQRIIDLLQRKGYAVKGGDQIINASSHDREVEVHLVAADLFDPKLETTLAPIPFTAVTAHAFMDVVPLDRTLSIVHRLLSDGGIFYATINYDGTTQILPSFGDQEFEGHLLARYNASMDERSSRRNGGSEKPPTDSGAIGGSRTGSQLYDRVEDNDFSVAGFGSSDWSIFPWNGGYSEEEAVFLNTLMLTMYEEGLRHPDLDRYTLSAWYAHRSQAIEEHGLSLITHQTDLLAVRR